jgi:hypothetical protein
MAQTIKIKRSAVPGKVPATLELGELALNTYDGKLYTKKDDGTASIVELSGGGAGGGAGGGTVGPVLEPAYYINENQTLSSYRNGLSVSPVEVASGYSVTVPDGATWWLADLDSQLFNSGITVGAGQTSKFLDADGSNWVGLKAPSTAVPNNVTWSLPATDGLVGQLLTTDGAGGLGWANRESKAKSYFYASF